MIFLPTLPRVSNPAKELYDQFEKWRGPTHPAKDRGMGDPGPGTAAHRRAMGQLLDIERRIDELERRGEDVSVYRRHLAVWTNAVICYPGGWKNDSASRNFPPDASMDVLHGLAQNIAMHFGQVRVEEATVRDVLADVEAALAEDGSLSGEIRWYISNLVAEIKHVVDDHEYVDGFDLNDALQRLWVSLKAAQQESDKPERWERASNFWRDVKVGVLVSLPQLALAVYQAQLALPGHH